jgi:hypothetical protein
MLKITLLSALALVALSVAGSSVRADEVLCSAQCWYLDAGANVAEEVSAPTTWGTPDVAFASLAEQCESPDVLMNVSGAQISSGESETWVSIGWYGGRYVLTDEQGVQVNLTAATSATSCTLVPPGQAGPGTTTPILD